MNMSPKNKAHFESEKEAIHLILTRIGDEIYSTVDACQTAQEMWEAIERLQQGESLNIQDVKTNLFWEFGKFTSHDGETMESYYTGFYKLMNEMIQNNLAGAMMQVNVQFLQQLQPEWSRFMMIVKQQHKLDKIAKPITPPSETASEEDSEPEQAQRDKDMQKNLSLIAKNWKHITATWQRFRRFLLLTQTPILSHWNSNTCLVEMDDSNVNPDSPNMCEDDIQNDQNDVESDDERVALANLIANLKLDVDENKKIQKQLKKTNTTLAQELKECETVLAKTSKTLGESISVRDSCLVALQNKQTEFEKY
nr:hypothetical protein [Tanacetum cinerariifolium]